MNRYTRMYGWLYEAFGEHAFTMSDFKAVFPSPQHPKTVHDLIRLGFLRRVGRGTYRVTEPEELVRWLVEDNLRQGEILLESDRPWAFSDADAVRVWTDGYYWTGFTKGFKPVHVKVLRRDLSYWRKFMRRRDAEFVLESESKTLFGVTFVLHPEKELKVEVREGVNVVPLEEVLSFCMKDEYTYRPALEYLEYRHGLHLYETHEHGH